MPTLSPHRERATRPIEPPASVEFGSRPSRRASRSASEKAGRTRLGARDRAARRPHRAQGDGADRVASRTWTRIDSYEPPSWCTVAPSASALHVRTWAPLRRTIPAPGSSPSSEASVSTSASPATTTRTALARVCQAMLAASAVREQRLTRVAEHDDPAGALARREPVRACKPLGEDRAQVPVDDWELHGDPLELGCVDDEDVEVAGRANRSRRGLAGEQRHLAERPARVHAADAMLPARRCRRRRHRRHPPRPRRARRRCRPGRSPSSRRGSGGAASSLSARSISLRRHAVEHRAAGRWTGCRCLMLFDRCQAPIVLSP